MNTFDPTLLRQLAARHGTPLWVYDAGTVRSRIARLRSFDVVRYAQKANANTHLLRLMRDQGVRVDAVSLGEIERALAAGYPGGGAGHDEIVFTADLIDAATLDSVVRHRIAVNAGSIDMLHQLGPRSPGHRVWLRINPGFGHGHSRKTNTGGEHSKHGIWHRDIASALAAIRQHRLTLVGLHMHIGSGVDYAHLQQVCAAMVELASGVDLPIEAISAGGGLSVPYRDGEPTIDTEHYFGLWDAARQRIAAARGHPVTLEIEPGRFLVAEAGVLLAEVRATKAMGSQHFVLVDAGFNDLMRPALYGSHHRIDLLGAPRPAASRPPPAGVKELGSGPSFLEGADAAPRPRRPCVVAGPLCESGDVFTQGEGGIVLTRELPDARVGDLLVFRDAGAYGASMSSNYNSRPLAAEVLVDGDSVRLIRRRQTIQELLALEAVDD